jgi:hypothetical protein
VQPVSQITPMATSIDFDNKVMMLFIDEMIGMMKRELTQPIKIFFKFITKMFLLKEKSPIFFLIQIN